MIMFSCECPALNSESEPNSILATRTLTTLISTLESAPTIRPTSRFEYCTLTTGNNREGASDPQGLRIPNAFATLLSRDGENTTVASRVTVQPEKQTNDVNIELVVCFDVDPPKLAMESQKADEKGPFLADSALKHPEKPYSFVESDHTGVDVSKGPHAFVEECFNPTGKAWKQTFKNHAQTLIEIIREPCGETKPSIGERQIMLAIYVVVSSHRKMLCRLTHTKYSQPYMKGLLRIANLLSSENFQQFGPLTLTSRDKTFLMSIQQIVSNLSHDTSQCKDIDCKLNCEYKLHLPQLCQIAKMAETSTETPMFYTEATFVEYHRLLINLLEHFKLHLRALVKDAQQGNDCHHHINMIRLFGCALHNMACSQIMNQHMLNIERSLRQVMSKQKQEEAAMARGVKEAKGNIQWPRMLSGERISMGTEMSMGSGVVELELPVEADNFDEALACVQWGAVAVDSTHMTGAAPRPMWKLCRDWLRLTVAHFTAMEHLLPTNPGRQPLLITPSITVLAAHYQGQHMLPWKDVLRDYLPVSDKFPSSSAEEIIEKITALQELAESQPSPLANWLSHHFGPGSKLARNEFMGPLHSEALIASLIYRAHDEGHFEDEPFLQLGTRLGVSCKCCPVCSHLLELLGKHLRTSPFIVQGSHNRVIGCTLPPWLPESVTHEIATTLAKRLRETLDDIFFAGEQSEARSSADLSLFSDEEDREAGAWGDQFEDDNAGDTTRTPSQWGSTLPVRALARVINWLRNLTKTRISNPSNAF